MLLYFTRDLDSHPEPKGEDIESMKIELESKGKKVYVVLYGGSNLLGAYGFVDAVKELKEQLTEMNLKIDYIFFASSSGGTQAGLKLGVDLTTSILN